MTPYDTFHGMKVYVQPDQPKMQLSERVKEVLKPEHIADHNAWLLRFFGVTNLLKDGETIVAQAAGFMQMNPRTYANFRAAIRESAGKG